VDPQFWNSRHLDRLSSASSLVAESAVYPPVLRPGGFRPGGFGPGFCGEQSRGQNRGFGFGRSFLCRSLFPLGRFVEDRTDPKGALGAGGSVATTAWDFARLLGPSAVWIAGLDLGFPGYKTHFSGALFEENAHAESTRFAPAETRSYLSLQSGFPFSAASASGGRVLTDRRLSIYGAWFENRISQERTLRNYSLSGAGLAVRGLVPAAVKELLALPPRRDEINGILEQSFAKIDAEFDSKRAARERRYDEAFKDLLRGLKAVKDEAEGAEKTAAGALRRFFPDPAEREKILAALDAANRAIAANPVKDAAGFLFPPPEELEARLGETDPWKRHLEFSALLYRELAAASEWTLKALGTGRDVED
jgi:hypothetical protein